MRRSDLAGLRFETARLTARDWQPDLEEPKARAALARALAPLLTRPVLAHLPPPLQLGTGPGALDAWISARAAESRVLRVDLAQGPLAGLLILAPDPEAPEPTLHLGYLLGEAHWGRGLASELLAGLVAALEAQGPITLLGGVDRANPASARVLEKAGFRPDPALSTADTALYRRAPR